LLQKAQFRWPGILAKFGLGERELSGKHTACPLCGGKDRFRFDDKSGYGSWHCNRCGAGTGIHLVERMLKADYRTAVREIEKVIGTVEPEFKPRAARATPLSEIKSAWDAGTGLTGDDPVSVYLASRAIRPIDGVRSVRQAREGMLALMRDTGGHGCQLHRTLLLGGRKAGVRFMPGPIPPGAAVRLMHHGATLGIAEGIETALSAAILFKVPCWAALNAALLERWEPPPDVGKVVIFGDNDRNGSWVGEAAAYALAKRLGARGLSVDVQIPGTDGADWNDVLGGGAHDRCHAYSLTARSSAAP
jgi:putative DNA primase/helicase